jgi:hypothetical protein
VKNGGRKGGLARRAIKEGGGPTRGTRPRGARGGDQTPDMSGAERWRGLASGAVEQGSARQRCKGSWQVGPRDKIQFKTSNGS